MLKKVLIGVAVIIILSAMALLIGMYRYQQLEESVTKIVPGEEGRIIFFNIGNGDRYYLASLMDSIAKCNPKVLAVDVFFDDLKDPFKDSILAGSIARNNVIQATKFDGFQYSTPHKKFSAGAKDLGYAQGISEGKFFKSFYPKQSYSGIEYKHFAVAIAQDFEPEKANQFLASASDEPMDIVFRKFDHQFKTYDFKDFNFDCSEIKDKIAYLGYMGPTSEDRHYTLSRYLNPKVEEDQPDMYGPVIVANQVLMILDGEFD